LSKEDILTISGTVYEVLPNAMFRVELENKHKIIAYLGGKMRKNDIKIIQGDSVDIEMSAYDMTRGRVIYRRR
jgi:translation initiation factor IF-1